MAGAQALIDPAAGSGGDQPFAARCALVGEMGIA